MIKACFSKNATRKRVKIAEIPHNFSVGTQFSRVFRQFGPAAAALAANLGRTMRNNASLIDRIPLQKYAEHCRQERRRGGNILRGTFNIVCPPPQPN